MNIVDTAARIIRPEAFEPLWSPHSSLDVARQNYQQSDARVKAIKILRLAMKYKDLRGELIANEKQGWRDLGVPIDDPLLSAVIEGKYAR